MTSDRAPATSITIPSGRGYRSPATQASSRAVRVQDYGASMTSGLSSSFPEDGDDEETEIALDRFASALAPQTERIRSSRHAGMALEKTRSITFRHDEGVPSWIGRRRMTGGFSVGNASSDDLSVTDDSDTDTDVDSISIHSSDGTFQPQFVPGHLLRRLRSRHHHNVVEALDEEAKHEEEEVDLRTYRRIPLLSGALAPFSIMLEVPGLTTKWYVQHAADGSTIFRKNPVILEVGLAISIASAIFANVMLICRFAGYLKPRRATLQAIVGFAIHDIINTVALIIFGIIHAVNDGFSYSQAYWMTVAATSASVLCTITLLADYLRTNNFKNSGSGLTPKQTQLVIVVIILLVYISIGSLIWALLLDLSFEVGLYFSVVLLLAVGFGDVLPTTVGSKIFCFFYTPIGILLFGITIYIASKTILEEFENEYRRRREEFQGRLKSRRKEMREIRREGRRLKVAESAPVGRRKKILRHVANRFESRRARSKSALSIKEGEKYHPIISPLRQMFRRLTSHKEARPQISAPTHPELLDRVSTQSSDQPYLKNTSSISTEHTDATTRAEATNHPEKVSPKSDGTDAKPLSPTDEPKNAKDNENTHRVNGSVQTENGDATGEQTEATERASLDADIAEMQASLGRMRDEQEAAWVAFREDLAKKERSVFWSKLFVSSTLFTMFWLLGAMVFHFTEGWSYFIAFYFCFVTMTTVGFGDYTPKTDAGRSFFIIWSLLGVAVLTVLFSVLSDAWGGVLTAKIDRTKESLKKEGRRLRDIVKRKKWSNALSLMTHRPPPEDKKKPEAEEEEVGESRRDTMSGDYDDGTPLRPMLSRASSRGPGSLATTGILNNGGRSRAASGANTPAAIGQTIIVDSAGIEGTSPPRTGMNTPSSLLQRSRTRGLSTSTTHRMGTMTDSSGTPVAADAAWVDFSPKEVANLPVKLAKSAILMSNHAANYIHARRADLLASLHAIPGARNHLPQQFGGELDVDLMALQHHQELQQQHSEAAAASASHGDHPSETPTLAHALDASLSRSLHTLIEHLHSGGGPTASSNTSSKAPSATTVKAIQSAHELYSFILLEKQTNIVVNHSAVLRRLLVESEREARELRTRIKELEAAKEGEVDDTKTEVAAATTTTETSDKEAGTEEASQSQDPPLKRVVYESPDEAEP